jgi:hypothetical protein
MGCLGQELFGDLGTGKTTFVIAFAASKIPLQNLTQAGDSFAWGGGETTVIKYPTVLEAGNPREKYQQGQVP